MVKTAPPRSEIPVEMTWNLESIYPTDAAWEEDFAALAASLPQLRALQGTLGQSGPALLHALQQRDAAGITLEKLYNYASMRLHEDTRRAQYQALEDRITTLYAELSGAIAFFTPEILAIPPERLEDFYAEAEGLQAYRHLLDDITRARPHIRSAEVEQVLASMIELAGAPGSIFEMIDNADLPQRFPTIQTGEGAVKLSPANYLLLIRDADRSVRRQAFEGMYATYQGLQNTISRTFASQIKKNITLARNRNYSSSIEAALDANNIPVSVYSNLVSTVEANLAPLHRYLRLRDRVLQLKGGQHMYDIYVPLVAEADVEVPYAEAQQKVVAALAPLGLGYTDPLSTGLRSRWIDVLENEGKRSGAYSSGGYATQPFILLNYQSRLDDMFTLAHELGHSMHSLFARKTQPYHYADYTIFLAEIASTFNEALLTQYLLQTTTDKALRTSVVNHYVDGFRATFYRQTMFASFELAVHQRAEQGESLTPELLNTIYKDLNDRYYGPGNMIIDDQIAWEWSRIPHFYSSFYVYQYATGIAASTALARAVLTEGQQAVDRYLRMLHSGSSDYSIDLLKQAGLDMMTPVPIEAAVAEFDRAVGELEALLA